MLTRRQFNKLLLSSVFISSTACNYLNKPDYIPGVLRLNLGFEPESLDWLRATDSYSFDVISNLMVGLTKYNNELKSVPSIASSWEITNENKTYTFHLNKNFKWTDGVLVTAHDFFYAWERLLNPKTGGPYAYLLHGIKNAYGYNTGVFNDIKELGIKVIDDFTFQVELEKPLAFFLNLTSYCFCFPQRKDVIEKFGDKWTEPENIVTCGPFMLHDWKHEYKVSLKRNPYYSNPIPKLNEIKYYIVPEQSSGFSLYLNNEIDWIDSRSIPISEISTVKKMKETKFEEVLRLTFIGFNVNKPPFNNEFVRAAFAHSIDRSVFPKILGRNESPTTAVIPKGLKDFYEPELGREFNPERAKEYLAKAGFPNGKGFPKVKMLFPTRDDVKVYVEAIQAHWKKYLNVDVELVNEEWKVYLSTLHNDPPHIYRMSWGADYPDPDTFMNLFVSDSGNNMGKWKNLHYDSLINKAASILDLRKRKQLYRHAQKILLEDDTAIVPLFFMTQVILGKPWVKNLKFNPMDLFFAEEIQI